MSSNVTAFPSPSKSPAVAILVSGQVRTLAQVFPTIRWHLLRRFLRVHVFASLVDEPGAAEALELFRPHVERLEFELVKEQNEPLPAVLEKWARNESFASFRNTVTVASFARWFWHVARAWEFYESFKDESHRVFFKLRTDCFFHRFQLPPHLDGPAVLVPWWGGYGGINDRLALITGRETARTYFTAYDRIDAAIEAGCPCHPESLLAGTLELERVAIFRILEAEFTTLRTAADGRPNVPPDYRAGDVFRYTQDLNRYDRVFPALRIGAPGILPGPRGLPPPGAGKGLPRI